MPESKRDTISAYRAARCGLHRAAFFRGKCVDVGCGSGALAIAVAKRNPKASMVGIFIRYMLLSLQQRCNTDERTIGELFLLMVDEIADTTFAHAMQLIVDTGKNGLPEVDGLH